MPFNSFPVLTPVRDARVVHSFSAAGSKAKPPRSSSSADPQQRQAVVRGSRFRGDWPCSAPPEVRHDGFCNYVITLTGAALPCALRV